MNQPEDLTFKKEESPPPWRVGVLVCWDICGMNHYYINGKKQLFVSMTRHGKCIREEGADNPEFWLRLLKKAKSDK